jgi:putative transposase
MSRPLRIQYENALYHVTCRGNARQSIFVNDHDRRKFIEILERSLETYQVHLLAFVLMTNHFHILVRTPQANLQDFMRHFNVSYTGCFNKAHNRSGHLYQGRYKSFLVDKDSYLLQASRYLHLNPIHISRLKGTSFEEKKEYLDTYQWSSYQDYVSSPRNVFLVTDDILAYFNGKEASYRRFVEEGILESVNPFEKAKGHGILGDASFIDTILKSMNKPEPSREQPAVRRMIVKTKPDAILKVVADIFHVTSEDIIQKNYKGPARRVAMECLYRYAGMNQREIGDMMGVDYSSVSVARKRLHEALPKDRVLQRIFRGLKSFLGHNGPCSK